MLYTATQSQNIQAIAFAVFLGAYAAVMLVLAFASVDSVILGSELNANGEVEYLCLGRACEDYTNFKW